MRQQMCEFAHFKFLISEKNTFVKKTCEFVFFFFFFNLKFENGEIYEFVDKHSIKILSLYFSEMKNFAIFCQYSTKIDIFQTNFEFLSYCFLKMLNFAKTAMLSTEAF